MGDEMTNTYDDNQHDREDNKQDKVSQVYELIKKAKGPGRSFTAYARSAGVSPASLTKIKNGEYMPSPDIMRKLTSEAADPQGGVTYDDLMRTAGYADHLMAYADMLSSRDWLAGRKNYRKLFEEYSNKCHLLVYSALVNKGIPFRKEKEETLQDANLTGPLLFIQTMDSPIKEWIFEYKYFNDRYRRPMPDRIFTMLGMILRRPLNDTTKLSVVVNNKFAFQMLERYDHALSVRGEVSAILVNTDKGIIENEVYLSNYYDGDRSREVYLTEDK